MNNAAPVLIAALGNTLRGDDGFGARVVAAIEERYACFADVELLDLGTPGAALVDAFLERRAVILIDAMAEGAPGELRRVDRFEGAASGGSPHDGDIGMALRLARQLSGATPDVVLIGAAGAEWDFSMELSEAMEAAVAPAVEMVLAELKRLGVLP